MGGFLNRTAGPLVQRGCAPPPPLQAQTYEVCATSLGLVIKVAADSTERAGELAGGQVYLQVAAQPMVELVRRLHAGRPSLRIPFQFR